MSDTPTKILSLTDVRALLAKTDPDDKVKPIILWPYRGRVEEGTVLYVTGDTAEVIWLEGYKSRNDSVPLAEVLSVHDKKGPEVSLSPFSGRGYLTEAGLAWQQAHPET
jgi:hypothetical protein